MTTVAELFVSLGVKGSEKTVGAIAGVRKGLEDTKGMALETKAAIVGALYALERMFMASGQKGTDLTNFNALLGVSAQTLQQYQYAARQVGVTNEEVASTFKGLSSVATNTLLGKGAPEGVARFAQVIKAQVGDVQKLWLQATQGHPELLLQRLQEYAQKESNIGLRNQVLKSFGISENMIAAMNRNAFNPNVLNQAPTLSEGTIKSLDNVHKRVSNLSNTVSMAFDNFTAKHGGEIIGGLEKIIPKVIELAEAFERLSNNLKIFKLIGMVFEGWKDIFEGLNTAVEGVADATADVKPGDKKGEEKKDEARSNLLKGFATILMGIFDPGALAAQAYAVVNAGEPKKTPAENSPRAAKKENTPALGPAAQRVIKVLSTPVHVSVSSGAVHIHEKPKTELKVTIPPSPIITPKVVVPPMPAGAAAGAFGGKTSASNVNVNQTLNFQHDGTNPKQVADSHKAATQKAYRQIAAVGNGA